jgi:hypothetical protein
VALSWGWRGEAVQPEQVLGGLGMVGALALLFSGDHAHEHAHAAVTHTHAHTHGDGHHDHTHDDLPDDVWHTHEHGHAAVTHRHAHVPDLHHRHTHG